MVTVTRELELDDYRAFAAFVARSARGPSVIWVGVLVGVFLLAGYGVVLAVWGEWDIPTSVASILAVLAWVVVIGRANSRAVAPAPDGVLLEPSELTVEDEGLRDRGPRAESLFRWPAVRQVAVTDRHVFIMFDRVLGLIVPRYCFADAAAEEEFLREVRRRCPEAVEWTDVGQASA
jgi:hypothetical protein